MTTLQDLIARETERRAHPAAPADELRDYRALAAQIAQLPPALTRAEYETACAALHLVALDDTDCPRTSYGDFYPPEYGAVYSATIALARRRLAGIRVVTRAAARPERPVEMVRCACGHSVPRVQMMNASRGSSCPDCYDRMSD